MTRTYSYNDKLGNELAEENFETVYVVCYLKLTSLDSTFLQILSCLEQPAKRRSSFVVQHLQRPRLIDELLQLNLYENWHRPLFPGCVMQLFEERLITFLDVTVYCQLVSELDFVMKNSFFYIFSYFPFLAEQRYLLVPRTAIFFFSIVIILITLQNFLVRGKRSINSLWLTYGKSMVC